MAKQVKALVKLQIPAGGANPAPPVGPALGQHGVQIMDFCKQFNEKTKSDHVYDGCRMFGTARQSFVGIKPRIP